MYSRSFVVHRGYLQALLNRVEYPAIPATSHRCHGVKEIVTLEGLFEAYIIPLYFELHAANRDRVSRGLAPLPVPYWEPFEHTWDVFLSQPFVYPPVAEWMNVAGHKEARRLNSSTRGVRFKHITAIQSKIGRAHV